MRTFDDYLNSGKYDADQLEEVSKAFERGLDVDIPIYGVGFDENGKWL